jgi:predicted RND superfamily exporter protein
MLTLARLALARPRAVLALLLAVILTAACGLFRLRLLTDGAAVYPRGDPTVEQTLRDRDAFGEVEQVILLATSRPGGPLVASPAGFRFLAATQAALERVEAVDGDGVRSLANLVEPPRHSLRLHTFFASYRGGAGEFADLLARIRRLPLASGLFLSADGRAAAFYVPVADDAERAVAVANLRRFVAASAAAPFLLRLTGPAAAETELGEEVLRDLERLVPVMVAVVALLLWLTLGTAGGVLVPLAQVLATLAVTMGLMGWAGVPVTLVTAVMPVLLMAMAMTDEVYLLERLQDHLAPGVSGGGGVGDGGNAGERMRRAATATFEDLRSPLVLISLTTSAGFFSFLGVSMAPLRHLGLFTGFGLLVGMLFTFTLAPALMRVLPVRWLERRRVEGPRGWRTLKGYERLLTRRGRAAAVLTFLLLALAIPGLFRLRVQDSWIDNFDPRSPLVAAERRFNASFWGSYRADVVFSGSRRTFWTASGVALLERFHRFASRAPHVGGALSVLPAFEAAAEVRGDARPVSALPPGEIRLIGAMVEILRQRMDISQLLTFHGDQARVRLFVRDADYAKARALCDAVAGELRRLPAGGAVAAHLSGDLPAGLAVVEAIVGNQLRSIGWTAVLIAAMLGAALRSARLTAAVMVPVLAATLLLFGGLGYGGVPLGIATSMFAALSLGAGVDFAVQYYFAYRRESERGGGDGDTVAATLATTGRGLRWNAVVLSCGLLVLTCSAIRPNASLGLLLAASMLVSYATTLILLPVLLARSPHTSQAATALLQPLTGPLLGPGDVRLYDSHRTSAIGRSAQRDVP